jgi:hypothetical protein
VTASAVAARCLPDLREPLRAPFSIAGIVTFPFIDPRQYRSQWHLLLALLLAFVMWLPAARAAESVDIVGPSVENSDDGYRLSLTFSFELPRSLEDALTRGIPLYFTTEVQLSRPRWYWFDEKTASSSQTIRLSYNVLTQQYRAALSGGGLQQNFASLEEALGVVRRQRMLIAEKGMLKPGELYNVMVRMGLDVARLPKPFQVHALNSSDWRFSSDWKQFTLRAE